MELRWITLATFRDGSLYQYRWFRDARGCGLAYRIHSPNNALCVNKRSSVDTLVGSLDYGEHDNG